MRASSWAMRASTACGSSGATSDSSRQPIAASWRGSPCSSASRSASVYRPSCGASASRVSGWRSETPQMPQASPAPAASAASLTAARCARAKAPRPRCTMPARRRVRSWTGRATPAAKPPRRDGCSRPTSSIACRPAAGGSRAGRRACTDTGPPAFVDLHAMARRVARIQHAVLEGIGVREDGVGLLGVAHVFLDAEVRHPQVEVQRRPMQAGDRSVAPWQPVRTW